MKPLINQDEYLSMLGKEEQRDVLNIQKALKERGFNATPIEIVQIWESYSQSCGAGWLSPEPIDETVEFIIKSNQE